MLHVNHIISRITLLLLLTLTAVMPACVTDDDACPDITDDGGRGGRYRLQFKVVTRSGMDDSRAADISGDEIGSVAENYLDVRAIRYYIFDSNQKFLADLTPNTQTIVANDEFTVYNVVAEVDLPYFTDNIDSQLEFYILAMANYTGWGATLPILNPGDDMSALFTDGVVLNYRPSTGALMLAATPGVSATQRQRFPMAGLQRFSLPGSLLLTTSECMPFDISLATGNNLNLLRTMAKLEVIDRINIHADSVFDAARDSADVRISRVILNGFNTRGRLLPIINIWQLNSTFETQQVIASSVPADPDYHIPPVLYADNTTADPSSQDDYMMPFVYDAVATNLRADKCPVYSCYIYEYSKASIPDVPATQQPYFTVVTSEYVDADGTTQVQSGSFPMRMARYTNGVATAADNFAQILRNHIYRFEISGVKQNLTVNWTVCPMDNASADIEFN